MLVPEYYPFSRCDLLRIANRSNTPDPIDPEDLFCIRSTSPGSGTFVAYCDENSRTEGSRSGAPFCSRTKGRSIARIMSQVVNQQDRSDLVLFTPISTKEIDSQDQPEG